MEIVERSLIGELPPDCDSGIKTAHGYWEAIKPSPELLPGRQHFDPTEIPEVLPYIWLIDVTRAPLRFRWRLLGSWHAAAMNGNHVGRWIDEVVPDFQSGPLYPQYLNVVERRTIAFRAGRSLMRKDRDFVVVERLIMPLAADGQTVDMIMGVSAFPGRLR